MAMRPKDLQTPERGLPLEDRGRPAQDGTPGSDPARDQFRERLDRARVAQPKGPHWTACWLQGRDAAIAAIEAARGDTAGARQLAPPAVIGCADCFRKGRDAVIGIFEAA